MGTLPGDQFTFIIISCSVLLRMGNCLDKNCREKSKHILCLITFKKNHAVYEIMWKNIVEMDRPHMTI